MGLLIRDQVLDRITKAFKVVVFGGVIMAVGLTVYARHKLNLAHDKEVMAEKYRNEGEKFKKDALELKAQADSLKTQLVKANAKNDKLQAALDKIKIPPKPGPPPANVSQTISDLQAMGLSLDLRPSLRVAPSVAGMTAEDAGKVWVWGKESLRVPSLELKLETQGNLIKGLDKAKTIAELLADLRERQAETAMKSADSYQKEGEALNQALADTKKALFAERRKKILYGIGGLALGYVVTKH